MHKIYFVAGTVLGCLAVCLGAFGAHALHELLVSLNTMATFKTASNYHISHALVLSGSGFVYMKDRSTTLKLANLSFLIGILIFSGSLYLLAVTGIRILGAITPIGGVFLITGWVLLTYYGIKKK